MKRTITRFFPIFFLVLATLLVQPSLRAMDPNTVIHREDGKIITQGDVDAFRTGTLSTNRFFALRPVFAKYKPILNMVDYGMYQEQTPQKLNEFADFFIAEFAKKNGVRQPSSSSNSWATHVAPVSTSPVIYQDKEIIITQQDLDHFSNRTLTKQRFDEILPTLSDLLESYKRHNEYCWDSIEQLTYDEYIDDDGYNYYSSHAPNIKRNIEKEIKQLNRSLVCKTVARKHPAHKQRAAAKKVAQAAAAATTTAASTHSTNTTHNPAVLYTDGTITITDADLIAFGDGSLPEDRFTAIAPYLAEEAPEIGDMAYEDYRDMELDPENRRATATGIAQQLKARMQQQIQLGQLQAVPNAVNQVTQADIDAFEYGELTQIRFNELQKLFPQFSNMSYDQYKELNSFKAQAAMTALGVSRTQITQMLVMGLNMQGAKLSMPKKRETIASSLWAATVGLFGFAAEVTTDAVSTVISGKNQFAERKKREQEKKAEEDNRIALEREADAIIAEYTDEFIDQQIADANPNAIVAKIEQEKKQAIKNQNCMLIGGLMPERVDWDWAGFHADIGKDMPYPIALYKKDLVYAAGFATKAAVAYWTISQLATYRAHYIYNDLLAHTDEFLALLKSVDHSIKNPDAQPVTRSWKQYGIDRVSGKGDDSTEVYNLKKYLNGHHGYIGYNPFKFPLLGHLALSFFTKGAVETAYKKLIIQDDSYEESRSAYYKDADGRLRKLAGMYRPISVTEAAQSLSPGGLWATLVHKIPKTVRRTIPIPLSKRDVIEKLENQIQQIPEGHTHAKKLFTFLKSDTMQHIGLFATAVFEITLMNNLYHARWHQWVFDHQDYLIDLLERYQQARNLPDDNELRLQLEEEILLSIKEGNMLSGLNRATLWRGIMHTALNKVIFLCTAPIIAYSVWHNKKLLGQLGYEGIKKLWEYLMFGIKMTPYVASFVAQHPQETAQAAVKIPVYGAQIALELGFHVARAVVGSVAAATIITGATIIHSEPAQKYGKLALEHGEWALEASEPYVNAVGKIGSAGFGWAKKLYKKLPFKRRGYYDE